MLQRTTRREALCAASAGTAAIVLGVVPAIADTKGRLSYYRAGSASGLKTDVEGTFSFVDAEAVTFSTEGAALRIAYAAIESVAFGESNKRPVWTAKGGFLFQRKRRKQYLTILYVQDGQPQDAVFELSQQQSERILQTLEEKTGKPIAYDKK